MAKKIKVIGGNTPQSINPLLTENEFSNSTALFNIGGFTITSNLNSRNVRDFDNILTTFSQPITLDTLKITDVAKLENITSNINNISLNFDKKNLYNFAFYGPLTERLRGAITTIIETWKGSLVVNNQLNDGNYYDTIVGYSYDSLTNQATFNIPTFLVQNKFNLNYTVNSQHITDSKDLSNLNYSYNKYNLFDVYSQNEYQILNFIGSYANNSGYIGITVKGNPYPEAQSAITLSRMFHLKPNDEEYKYFYNNLDSLQKYLLNQDDSKYTITVKVPMVNDDDQTYFIDKKYTWTTSDGYNIDIDNSLYSNYFNGLISLGESYDEFKTDIIYRMFLPDNVKTLDLTENQKTKQFTKVLGRELDEVKSFIDGLVYINNVSYDKVDNTPDKLVKNLASTLGWDVFNLIETEDLFASIFNVATDNTPTQSTSAELDIELWRRIIINTQYLFKAKGTRKALEAIFSFIGAPPCLVELNEHVYTVSGKINPNTVDLELIFPLNEDLTLLPYDRDGFPVASNEINSYYFQIAGNSDSGQEYIDVYRKLGFNVTKTVDNKKSWVYSESAQTRTNSFNNNETNYTVDSSKLIINTKEVGITLDPIQAIECDIYSYNFAYNYPVAKNGRPFPYPQRSTNNWAVSATTFNEYVTKVYSTFVNVQNRKVIDDNNGGGYPALTKLYYDYLYRSFTDNGVQSNEYSIRKIFSYIKTFQNYYTKFFDQLISATTIIDGQGIKIRNTVFTPQKFVYKRGINESSEFSVKQPENVSDSLSTISIGQTSVTLPNQFDIRIWKAEGIYTYSSGESGGPNDTLITLSEIVRPKVSWESEFFVFTVPQYTMVDSASKIASGITGNTVYYFDNVVTGKTLNFIFTGDTISLSASNNTFTYNLYSYNKNINQFNSGSSYSNTVLTTSFASASTFTDIVNKVNLNEDTEYLVKGYFNSYINAPTASTLSYNILLDYYDVFNKYIYPVSKNYYSLYFDESAYSSYTGTVITTKQDLSLNNLPYGIYDSNLDWYFISVGNPDQPVLVNLDNTTSNGNSAVYMYERLIPNVNNEVLLSYSPVGDVQLTINGSSLIKNLEYQPKTNVSTLYQGRLFELLVPYSSTTDVLTVAYLANTTSYALANESYIMDYIPTGSTQSLPYKVLYNNVSGKFEYYLDQNVSGDTTNVQINWNGAPLLPNSDYFLSLTNSKKIVFDSVLFAIGDTITAVYTSGYTQNTNPFIITNNPYQFQWSIPNAITYQTGGFTLEFSKDLTFSAITTSNSVSYQTAVSSYSNTIDFTAAPYSGMTQGGVYNLRVNSLKSYTGITQDVYYTNNFSEIKKIKIPF